jgi:hypothetical protein
VDDDERQDHEIVELQEDIKRLRVLESQIKLVARLAMASLASIAGFAGSVIYKWQDLQVDLSDLNGKLVAHERWGEEAAKNMQRQLDECREDLKELTHSRLKKE